MAMTGGERYGADSAPPSPTLTVAAVARRLGVAPSTLRTWDRRYGLGPSAHVAGSHRRYSAADLSRLVVMRRLTLEGIAPSEAAQIAQRSVVSAEPGRMPASAPVSAPAPEPALELEGGAGADVVQLRVVEAEIRAELGGAPVFGPAVEREPDPEGHVPALTVAVDEDDLSVITDTWAPGRTTTTTTTTDRLGAGGGRVIALPEGSPQARGLARAALALDTPEVGRLLEEAVRQQGVIRVWSTIAAPVLRALADRSGSNADEIVVETAFSEAVMAVMRGVAFGVRRPRNIRPVLLAGVGDDPHTLPMHVLAGALAEQRISTRFLGSCIPMPSVVAAVRRCGPIVVFCYAHTTAPDAGALEAVRRIRPAPRIVLGGPGWTDSAELPTWAPRVDDVTSAVDEVLAALHP